jgi:hypothetical protein
LEPLASHSLKPPKAKPKVQTFGHEFSQLLDLDGHNVKPSKAKPKVQRKKVHPTLLCAQNNPSNLTTKILSNIFYFVRTNRQPLNHSLGFHSHLTQTFLQGIFTLVKKYCHVGILESGGLCCERSKDRKNIAM